MAGKAQRCLKNIKSGVIYRMNKNIVKYRAQDFEIVMAVPDAKNPHGWREINTEQDMTPDTTDEITDVVSDVPLPVEPSPAVDPLLLGAIAELDPDNKEHYTNGGKPDAKVLSGLLDRNVSAKERDVAFAEFSK
jgi:hypothetical protein